MPASRSKWQDSGWRKLAFLVVVLPNHQCAEGQKGLEHVAMGHCSWGATAVPAPEDSTATSSSGCSSHCSPAHHSPSGWFPGGVAEADDLVAPVFCRRNDVSTYLVCCLLFVYLFSSAVWVWGRVGMGGGWVGGSKQRGYLECISVRLSVVSWTLFLEMVVLLITSQENKVLGILIKRFCH